MGASPPRLFPPVLPPDAAPVLCAAWLSGLDTSIIAQALSVLFGQVIPESAVYNALPIIMGRKR